jgi:SAM-dependent methyltransferase
MIWAANGFNWARVREIPPDALKQALAMGYLRWSRSLACYAKGADVIDVGCGMGLHGVRFLAEGANSYVGVDPEVKPRSSIMKDLHNGKRIDCGWTPEALMARMSRFEMIRGLSNDLEDKREFDLATLHNASEHLVQLEAVFASVHRLLRPGGRMVFSHHNWFSWNGHHQAPKTIDKIQPQNPEHTRYFDWAHLEGKFPADSYVMTKLNRFRLSEVRALTEKQFEIEAWKPTLSTPDQGAGRLTDAVRKRHPDLSESDFTTQSVWVVARKKA